MDMFGETLICGIQIIWNNTKVNKYFVGVLNALIVLPMKNTQINVQQIKIISQYSKNELV